MLSEQELNKIFSWLPYRNDWSEDEESVYYMDISKSFIENILFDTYQSQDGGLSNFLGFICYPRSHKEYRGNAIIVYISLCAPIATYGQTTFQKLSDAYGYNFLKIDSVCTITDIQLKQIENEIINLLSKNKLTLLDKEFLNKPLSKEISENLKHENHNEGNQYLHGLFQEFD